MPIGSLSVSPFGLLGNEDLVNALMMGAFSIGSIWTMAGHLWMFRRAKENTENILSA